MVKDFRNIDITPGDTVVYPGRHGSSVWMNCGRVLSVQEATHAEPASIRVRRDSGRAVTVSSLKNVCVLQREGL